MFAPGAVAIQSEIFHFFGHKPDAGMGLQAIFFFFRAYHHKCSHMVIISSKNNFLG